MKKDAKISSFLDRFVTHKIFIVLLLFLALLSRMGTLCSHWRDYHRHDALRHMYDYHERNNEVVIRNEEDRHYRHEEALEYEAKFAETAREHGHEHREALKRDHEQIHENDETTRENERDSRGKISNHPKDAVIDGKKARSFLKKWPKY